MFKWLLSVRAFILYQNIKEKSNILENSLKIWPKYQAFIGNRVAYKKKCVSRSELWKWPKWNFWTITPWRKEPKNQKNLKFPLILAKYQKNWLGRNSDFGPLMLEFVNFWAIFPCIFAGKCVLGPNLPGYVSLIHNQVKLYKCIFFHYNPIESFSPLMASIPSIGPKHKVYSSLFKLGMGILGCLRELAVMLVCQKVFCGNLPPPLSSVHWLKPRLPTWKWTRRKCQEIGPKCVRKLSGMSGI